MNRSVFASRQLVRFGQPWLGAVLALTLAIGAGVLLAQLLMSPPSGDLRTLAAYLTVSGVASLGLGWLALRVADRAVGLTIQAKAFLSSIIGSGVALLNIFIVAQLMFVSTAHDLNLLIALILFSAIVTLFFSLWVATTVAGRIELVASGIRSLAGGDYQARLADAGKDEVAQLAVDVNLLAARLQAAEEQRAALDRERRELTAAISHDLRTPLASVRAMVEALDDHVVEEAGEVKRYYGTMRREIERLSSMIDDLFELARMDAGALELERRPVALQEVAAEVVDAMQAQAKQAGVALALRVDGSPSELSLDGARIERVAANLVRNALEHAPAGGQVAVRVFAENGWATLEVTDNGEGMEPDVIERVWDRFYRGERSRQRKQGAADGAGLGLAIVRGFVEAHGGTVEVSSAAGRGATFTVRLPAS
ncbi:MAG: HAMP domain-containing histidine kinase [Chloroflexi bacterium]|nr:HAMP domain-containing histidine kinase [Chloroflexota bacterium]